jgi:ribosome-associated translation inhibitor RaiA
MKKSLTKSEPTPTSAVEQAVPTFVPDPPAEESTVAPRTVDVKYVGDHGPAFDGKSTAAVAPKTKLIAENEAKAELRAPAPKAADVAVERQVTPFGRPVQKAPSAECTVYREPADGNTVETLNNVIKELLVTLQNISISTAKPADDLRASADAAVRKFAKHLRK